MSESDVLAQILLTLGHDSRWRLWRASVLVARDKTGRVIRAGTVGQADIFGILAPSGRFIAIECKSATGKLRPEQANWRAMAERFGALWILARSVHDAECALLKAYGEATCPGK